MIKSKSVFNNLNDKGNTCLESVHEHTELVDSPKPNKYTVDSLHDSAAVTSTIDAGQFSLVVEVFMGFF